MISGNKQQSLFSSNPLVLFLVGMGVVLIAVLLAVMVLKPGGQLKTIAYPSSPSPSPSVLVGKYCSCNCIADYDLDSWLCPTELNENFLCGDGGSGYWYEDFGITDKKTCEQKNDTKCTGYDLRYHSEHVSEGKYACRLKDVFVPASGPLID